MRTEFVERETFTGRTARVTDARGRDVLTVHEYIAGGVPLGFYAAGLLLSHIDGDRHTVRHLSAPDLPAAVIEARALVVRELADHAARIAEAAKEFTEGDDAHETHETDLRQPGGDGDVHRPEVGAAAD